MDFAAIDFETFDYGADSACAVGLVGVRGGKVSFKRVELIRPPRKHGQFTHIHGITWDDVKNKPSFRELWPSLEPLIKRVRFLAAHNASFDRAVLRACCASAGLPMPSQPFLCTVSLSRKAWGIRPTTLSDVCSALEIELNHHEALSDASACAEIVLRAQAQGATLALS